MPPVIERNLCSNCGICDKHCPIDVIFCDEQGVPTVKYSDECWHCGSCRQDCPKGAISIIFGPEMLCL